MLYLSMLPWAALQEVEISYELIAVCRAAAGRPGSISVPVYAIHAAPVIDIGPCSPLPLGSFKALMLPCPRLCTTVPSNSVACATGAIQAHQAPSMCLPYMHLL